MFSRLSVVSAWAGGVVNPAYVVEPGFLGASFAAIPGVGVEGMSVPVRPSICLCGWCPQDPHP